MIERPIVDVRVLGASRLVRIESRATLFATGNNLVLVGDVVRRVLLCSLDPELERPELRQFKRNPLEAVLNDRGKYIAAALTIVNSLTNGPKGGEPVMARKPARNTVPDSGKRCMAPRTSSVSLLPNARWMLPADRNRAPLVRPLLMRCKSAP